MLVLSKVEAYNQTTEVIINTFTANPLKNQYLSAKHVLLI